MKKEITDNYSLLLGDNIQLMKTIEDNSIHSVLTDPPYGLTSIVKRFGKSNSADAQYGTDGVFKRSSKGFMGKEWDSDVPSVEFWREVFRILKPGGHILSFGGTRTYHRMATAIENAGFEIIDQLQWVYGSGFPKSHNIGKKLEDWKGWGTALKPANEPICMARKPISEKTIAKNVLKYGTGGINIDGCRIGNETRTTPIHSDDIKDDKTLFGLHKSIQHERLEITQGRFPSNVIFDQDASKILDKQTENVSQGGASRFFYCPKVSKKERDLGLEDFDVKSQNTTSGGSRDFNARCANCGKKFIGTPNSICSCDNPITDNQVFKKKNNHPTVKPINLLSYLVKLITPVGGTVLDPFMGSGSGGIGTLLEGFNFIGMEQDPDYFEIATARIKKYESYREILTKPKKTKREKVIVEKDLEIGETVMTFWLNQAV
jgi:site-specific DNA-methyltransferase (adenine-specific)